MEFLKFRGLWRLLRVPVCFTPGTPSPTENSFLTWREGECRNFYLSLPLVRTYWRSLAPLEQKHFESRSLHSHTLGCYSSSSLFHIFRLKLPGGSEPVFPPSVLFGLAINLDIDSKKEKKITQCARSFEIYTKNDTTAFVVTVDLHSFKRKKRSWQCSAFAKQPWLHQPWITRPFHVVRLQILLIARLLFWIW